MADLLKYNAKFCPTVAACLIHDNKVLLVKHKKLGLWLNPGGHIGEGELPHQAAEREFWEEAGIKVRTVSSWPMPENGRSEYMPVPFVANMHWISQENYEFRTAGKERSAKTQKNWGKGCEQHFNYLFLVEPVAGVEFKQNLEETDGISWFTQEEVENLDTSDNIKSEIKLGFAVAKQVFKSR